MSYILDALRKAEQERHLGRPPNPIASPSPAQPPRQRLWLWLGLGLGLGVNIALLAYFLIQPQPASWPAATAPPAPVRPERSAASATQEPAVPEPAAPVSPPAVAGRSPASAPLPSESSRPSAVVGQERPRKSPSKPTPGPSVTIGPEPAPLLDALPASARRGFPTLNLDIHVYSPDADKRFVVVNGRRYREGDQIEGGPVLETVTLGGAILRQGSRRFRLSVPH